MSGPRPVWRAFSEAFLAPAPGMSIFPFMETIGRYTVQRELGRGCMGVVYLAFDPRVRRQVAVKTIELPAGLDAAAQAEFRERFLREAQAAGNLSHPSIVTIYDADEDPVSGKPFIVMEYVEGGSLRESLQQNGAMEPAAVLALGHAMAGALGAAHKAGIIHRDIKPANLLMPKEDGLAKLADFGVARLDGSELTRSGATVGSPAYMAPEQVAGRQVDRLSDMFSLAAVLYETLTGEKPFQGADLTSVLYAVAHTDPLPPTSVRPGLPAGVDRFFRKALAKKPEDRYQDAARFREALDDQFREAPVVPAQELGEATLVEGAGQMEKHSVSPAGSSPVSVEAGTWRRFLRRPIVMVAAVLFLLWIIFSGGDATLKLEARSAVEKGKLTVYVDGDKVWSTKLRAPLDDGKSKKIMRKWLRVGQEQFDTSIDISSGKHTVSARMVDDKTDQSYEDSVVIEVQEDAVQGIKVIAGGPFGSELTIQKD
jgi:predicted Ser/Thr protein kinase